jgi:hypothetical protein
MPLKPGYKNMRSNIEELNSGYVGPARKKAIKTIAKKNGISSKEARFKQSLAIAYSKSKEK